MAARLWRLGGCRWAPSRSPLRPVSSTASGRAGQAGKLGPTPSELHGSAGRTSKTTVSHRNQAGMIIVPYSFKKCSTSRQNFIIFL